MIEIGDLVVWRKVGDAPGDGLFLKVIGLNYEMVSVDGEDANGTPIRVPIAEVTPHPHGLDECEMCK